MKVFHTKSIGKTRKKSGNVSCERNEFSSNCARTLTATFLRRLCHSHQLKRFWILFGACNFDETSNELKNLQNHICNLRKSKTNCGIFRRGFRKILEQNIHGKRETRSKRQEFNCTMKAVPSFDVTVRCVRVRVIMRFVSVC